MFSRPILSGPVTLTNSFPASVILSNSNPGTIQKKVSVFRNVYE